MTTDETVDELSWAKKSHTEVFSPIEGDKTVIGLIFRSKKLHTEQELELTKSWMVMPMDYELAEICHDKTFATRKEARAYLQELWKEKIYITH